MTPREAATAKRYEGITMEHRMIGLLCSSLFETWKALGRKWDFVAFQLEVDEHELVKQRLHARLATYRKAYELRDEPVTHPDRPFGFIIIHKDVMNEFEEFVKDFDSLECTAEDHTWHQTNDVRGIDVRH